MTRDYTCCPGDYIPCPECDAPGGPDGMTRARGVMTDREYKDRRCNSCGHLWTVGDTLELPLGEPEPPSPGSEAALEPPKPSGTDVDPYDFGNGWKPEPGEESVPF